jgi:hypothetical protein
MLDGSWLKLDPFRDRNSPRRPREPPSRSGLPRSRRAASCAQQVIPIKPLSNQSCAHAAGRTGPDGNPSIVARTLGCSLGSHFVAFFALALISPDEAEHDESWVYRRDFKLDGIGRAISRPLSCSSGASPKTARRGYYASAKAVSSRVDYDI